MHWEKMTNNLPAVQKKNILALLLFVILFFGTRVPRLLNDTINPDAVNWHYRTEQFVNGLKYFQFEKTYQHYHPGVTMMWITGVSTEFFKQVTGIKIYDNYSFPAFDFISKLSLVVAQLIVTLYIIFILAKYFGRWGAILIMGMTTFEPFFIGNSRLYHMDILFTLLLFAALLTGYLAIERQSNYYYGTTSVLFALAFLTKSIGILGLGFYGLWVFKKALIDKQPQYFKQLALVTICFVSATFILFPALWVKPVYYITQVFTESERIGLRRGHEQILFGKPTNEASFWFYTVVTALKASPFMLLGLLLSLIYTYKLDQKYKRQINKGFIFYLMGFAFLYFLVISLAPKKIDRYILPVYPFLAVASYYGYLALAQVKNFKVIVFMLLALFVIYPFFSFFPYEFTYTSPLFGSPAEANSVIGQKSFGIGVYDLKEFLIERYGEKKVGFIDIKPIETIYPNSKVYDIRVSGSGDYDLVVLGINETLDGTKIDPKNTTAVVFKQDASMYINGLEYWRVYVKQK